jgi:hypothetical protein
MWKEVPIDFLCFCSQSLKTVQQIPLEWGSRSVREGRKLVSEKCFDEPWYLTIWFMRAFCAIWFDLIHDGCLQCCKCMYNISYNMTWYHQHRPCNLTKTDMYLSNDIRWCSMTWNDMTWIWYDTRWDHHFFLFNVFFWQAALSDSEIHSLAPHSHLTYFLGFSISCHAGNGLPFASFHSFTTDTATNCENRKLREAESASEGWVSLFPTKSLAG